MTHKQRPWISEQPDWKTLVYVCQSEFIRGVYLSHFGDDRVPQFLAPLGS